MNSTKRSLSLVLILCMVVSVFAVSSVTSSARTIWKNSNHNSLTIECTNITPETDTDSAFNVIANKCDKKSVTIKATTYLDSAGTQRVKNLYLKCSYDNTDHQVRSDVVQNPASYEGSYTWDTTDWPAGTYNILVSSAIDHKSSGIWGTGKGWNNANMGTITVQTGGHSYSWVTTTNPTCTATGVESYKCSNCGDVSNTRTVNALGHDFSNKTKTSTYL